MAVIVNMGNNVEILNLTLNASTDVAIDFTVNINNILIRNRGSGDLQYRKNDNDAEYFTVPEGLSLTVELGARSTNAGYLRAGTGTPVAEVLGMY